MKDHILSEAIAKQNGILEHCMYCSDAFGPEDKWKLDNNWFSTYISVTCSSCHREHRFKDEKIHTKEDLEALIEKLRKN